jgi:hypothetical protein
MALFSLRYQLMQGEQGLSLCVRNPTNRVWDNPIYR